jgi:hypothetical protein
LGFGLVAVAVVLPEDVIIGAIGEVGKDVEERGEGIDCEDGEEGDISP